LDFGAQSEFSRELTELIYKYDNAVQIQVAQIKSMLTFVEEDQKYLNERAEKAK